MVLLLLIWRGTDGGEVRDRSGEHWDAVGELSYCDPGNQGAGGFDVDAIAAVHSD